MSRFIKLHLLHDKDPMLVNLDDVRWIGRTEQGNTVIKFIPRKEKDGTLLTVYEEQYDDVEAALTPPNIEFNWEL